MEKFCFIKSVMYQEKPKHIVKVKGYFGTGKLEVFTRAEVVSFIEKGYNVCAVTGKTQTPVVIHPVKGKKYIKTVPNDIEEDNLGELPAFIG